MLYVIHGEDTASSRTKLLQLIDGVKDIVRLDGKKQSLGEALDAFAGKSLFSNKRIIIVEYFTKIKPAKTLLEEVLKSAKDSETTIILWEDGDIDSKTTEQIKPAMVFAFSFPKVFYQFLDGFGPKNKKKSLLLFQELLKTGSAEQVLYSLIKRVRNLIMIKGGKAQEFSETRKMSPWQLSKLEKQAGQWSEEELKKTFLLLLEFDEKIKTGALTLDLASHLDILLLSDLN